MGNGWNGQKTQINDGENLRLNRRFFISAYVKILTLKIYDYIILFRQTKKKKQMTAD